MYELYDWGDASSNRPFVFFDYAPISSPRSAQRPTCNAAAARWKTCRHRTSSDETYLL